jgi:hypothetical protein
VKTPGILPTWDAVEEFLFAGNATFTLRSAKTGARFTYKLSVKKGDLLSGVAADQVVYFANLLRGPDNTADFAYMGVVRKAPARFFWTAASGKVGRQAPALKALLWALDAMRCRRDVLCSSLEVWHEGRCGACGRKLTVPESIAAGLGPECAGRSPKGAL